MGILIETTVRLIRAGRKAYGRKWSFFGFFVFAFLGSVTVLAQFDLLPNASPAAPAVAAPASPNVALSSSPSKAANAVALPARIEIPAIKLAARIVNPTTTNIEVLDKALLSGAVRYPTSAKLGETGNVVLFGHSSYLPVVSNQAYKTFNDIQKLAAGDTITVYSTDAVYTYRVRSVAKENAKSNEGIPLEISGRALTLVTCNSFGAKEDRFVVTADFVESHAVSG